MTPTQDPLTLGIEQIRAIAEAMPAAIVVVDAAGVIQAGNAVLARLFGYGQQELVGRAIETLVPERFQAPHPQLRQGYCAAPTQRPMGGNRELFARRKDGTEFPVEIGLNPIITDSGTMILGAIVDLSERKRQESRLRATIEGAPMAMLMIDAQGSIVLLNAETERLFGYDRDELRGQKVEVLVPERFRRHHPEHRSRFHTHPEARRMGEGRELFGLRKNGSEFPIEIGLSPVHTDLGTFVLSAIVDISERTRQANEVLLAANEALRRSNEQLERSNIELQRFAYIASHDLQTPLRSIASFVDLIRVTYGESLDEEGRTWIDRIVGSVRHLQELIRHLLDYSRIDSASRSFEAVPMHEVVVDAMNLLDAPIRESGATITSGDLPTVQGDRSQLVQLLVNLIGNSLKYRGPEPPRVEISSAEHANGWVFSLRDNGIGIAPRYHDKVFEIFQRLHNQQEYPGTGIGLAVCRKVVLRHGGSIWIESNEGAGTTFRFTIADRGTAS
jgi:PAS domain S-box-containing protein